MKKSTRVIALFIAVIMSLACFTIVSVAEPAVDNGSIQPRNPATGDEPVPDGHQLNFTVYGTGSLYVYKTSTGELLKTVVGNGTSVTDTVYTYDPVYFCLDTMIDMEEYVTCTESNRAIGESGKYYYIVPTGNADISVTIPNGFDTTVTVGAGGNVSTKDFNLINGEVYAIRTTPGGSLSFDITPDEGYVLDAVFVDGALQAVTDNKLWLTDITSAKQVNITFKVREVVPQDVIINVGANGSASVVNGMLVEQIGAESSKTISSSIGTQLAFTLTPDEGFEVKTVNISGKSIVVTDNSFTADVTAGMTVSIEFQPISEDGVLHADYITDWNADEILFVITGGKLVHQDVFEMIASLDPTSDKSVKFQSEGGVVYIPYGSNAPEGEEFDLSISTLTEGAEYAAISAKFSAPFKVFKIAFADIAPSGTEISLNAGSDFNNRFINVSSFINNGVDSSNTDKFKVSSNTSDAFKLGDYNNSSILVCSMAKVNVTVSITGNGKVEKVSAGGTNEENTVFNITAGEATRFAITAEEGFVIEKLLIDGAEITAAAGLKFYGELEKAFEADASIEVFFKAEEAADEEVSSDSSDTSDESEMSIPVSEGPVEEPESGSKTWVVVLVIVIVALLGAAGLFVVKWRQEKF